MNDPIRQERAAAAYVASLSTSPDRLAWTAPAGLFPDTRAVEDVFRIIYDRQVWGRGSGGGSELRTAAPYVAYLQHLMDRCSVQTVIDVGCGDWTYSRHLDFSGRQYLGIDVVPSVIARNIAEFGAPNVRFTQENLCAPGDLPDCDLLLCKDVLQHLSTANVMAILGKIGGARMALITNDYHPSNRDCSNGDTRPLDVSAPPFNFPGRPVLAFGGKVSFLAQSST